MKNHLIKWQQEVVVVAVVVPVEKRNVFVVVDELHWKKIDGWKKMNARDLVSLSDNCEPWASFFFSFLFLVRIYNFLKK